MGQSTPGRAGTARSIAAALLAHALALSLSSGSFAQPREPAVKLSRTGICHDAASQHYARLQDYKPFDSMDACLRAGGRLSQAEARRQQAESQRAFVLVALIAVGVGVAAILWLYRRRQGLRPTVAEAEFREAERRRWEGHRLDPPRGPKP